MKLTRNQFAILEALDSAKGRLSLRDLYFLANRSLSVINRTLKKLISSVWLQTEV